MPSSELAHFALFGYAAQRFPGRAVLEAAGAGIALPPDAVAAYAALRSVVERDGALASAALGTTRPRGTLAHP